MGIKGGNRQESGYTLLQDISLSLPLIFSLLSSSQNLEIYVKFVMKSKLQLLVAKIGLRKNGFWSSLDRLPAALKICIEQTVKLGQLMLGESLETSAVLIQNMQSHAEICT